MITERGWVWFKEKAVGWVSLTTSPRVVAASSAAEPRTAAAARLGSKKEVLLAPTHTASKA